MNKILTSPSSFGQISNEPFEILEKNGYSYINNPFGRRLTENETIDIGKNCIGIVAGVEPITAKVMDALPNLRCISRVGVGMDSIDLEYAIKKGIVVVNTPNGPTRAVAEMTLSMVMSLLRKIPQADAAMKNGIWKKETGNLLFRKKIGVIGLGRIGKMVATMFKNLGNPIIGYDLYPDKSWTNKNEINLVSLSELIEESDIITVHIPPKKNKKPILGKEQLIKMKTSSFIINASRGGVVDEEILFQLLKDNKIAGAAIDVFSEEPYNGQLTSLSNVVLTPHLGSYAAEGKLQMEIDAVNNLIEVLKNEI